MNIKPASSRIGAVPPASGQAAEAVPDVPPRAAVSQWHYSLQAAAITFNAFSWPTILVPLLRPPDSSAAKPLGRAMMSAYRMRNLAAGMIFIDQMQPPQRVRFTPAAEPLTEMAGYAIGMSFYIPFFALHAHLANGWCSRQGSRGERMSRGVREAWRRLCLRLPPGVAREVALQYPISFVLARVPAQMASVGVGSVVGGALHRARGATLEPAPQPARAPGLIERIAANPAAYGAAALAFSCTNRMSLAIERDAASRGMPIPAADVARLTTAVVLACVITAMVHPRDNK
jgi:hypothetical protein